VVEQNRDAQLRSLLTLETAVPKEKLRSVLAFGGFPLQATQVVAGVTSQLGGYPQTPGQLGGYPQTPGQLEKRGDK
jgi:hypothetical protein